MEVTLANLPDNPRLEEICPQRRKWDFLVYTNKKRKRWHLGQASYAQRRGGETGELRLAATT